MTDNRIVHSVPRTVRVTVLLLVILLLSSSFPCIHVVGLRYGKDISLQQVDVAFLPDIRPGFSTTITISNRGDLNGDGYDDVVIGLPGADVPNPDSGVVYIFFGKPSGWPKTLLLSEADASIVGQQNDEAGRHIATGGDINSDGYDDLLISGFFDVYIFFGKKDGWTRDTSIEDSDASIDCDRISSLVFVGDTNGDDIDDFVIGLGGASYLKQQTGRIFLFFGRVSGWSKDVDILLANASFVGAEELDRAGVGVARAGDVNGDGFSDFLIMAPRFDGLGEVYLILGRSTPWIQNTLLSQANASFQPNKAGGDILEPDSFEGVGDVNDDGFDDILIGIRIWTNMWLGTYRGHSYLFLGKATGWTMDTEVIDADASFRGVTSNDKASKSLSWAGDVNGDGMDDILIGAESAYSNCGGAYLMLGRNDFEMNTSLADAPISFSGENLQDRAGLRVKGGGDNDGDGLSDIILLAPGNDDASNNWGKMYLIFPDHNEGPLNVISIIAYKDAGYSQRMSFATKGDRVYLELEGSGGNSSRKDVSRVWISNEKDPSPGFPLNLVETNVNSGKYRGFFNIANRTNKNIYDIHGYPGEFINVSFFKDPTTFLNIPVGKIQLHPDVGTMWVNEDDAFSLKFWTDTFPVSTWDVNTDASWLTWDEGGGQMTFSGTPINKDVGSYNISIKAIDTYGNYDEKSFTLVVNNTPPNIMNEDVTIAYEDIGYSVDYQTDDNDASFHWEVETDALWLRINRNNGNLNGIPTNDDIGSYRVNVSVFDAWGASNYTEFTLKVYNTNDEPELLDFPEDTKIPVKTPFVFDVNATDVDDGDVLSYGIKTTPSSFMSIDERTGIINWTPDERGIFLINISVTDNNATIYHEFVIQVYEISSPPISELVSPLNGSTLKGLRPRLQWKIEDEDSLDFISKVYLGTDHVKVTNHDPHTLVASTILMNEFVLEDQLAWDTTYFWTVIPYDGIEFGECRNDVFTFKTPPEIVNSPPTIGPVPKKKVIVGEDLAIYLQGNDPDSGDTANITYFVESAPKGLFLDKDTGIIHWKPTEDQVGIHKISIGISDGKDTSNMSFEVKVKPSKVNGGKALGANQMVQIVLIALIVVFLVISLVFWIRRGKGGGTRETGSTSYDQTAPSMSVPNVSSIETTGNYFHHDGEYDQSSTVPEQYLCQETAGQYQGSPEEYQNQENTMQNTKQDGTQEQESPQVVQVHAVEADGRMEGDPPSPSGFSGTEEERSDRS